MERVAFVIMDVGRTRKWPLHAPALSCSGGAGFCDVCQRTCRKEKRRKRAST